MTPHAPAPWRSHRPSRGLLVAAAAVLLWSVLMARPSEIVLTQPWLRTVESVLRWSVPYAVVGYGALAAPWRAARWAFAAVGGLAVAGLVVAAPVLILGAAFGDPERGRTRLAVLPHRGAQLALDQLNCGATCDFGLRLARETPVLPGVLWRERLWSRYPADTGRLTLLPGDSVRVQFRGQGGPVAVVPLARSR